MAEPTHPRASAPDELGFEAIVYEKAPPRATITLNRPEKRNALSIAVRDLGSDALDASLLMMPMVGFLPIEDERVRNTIAAIERDLLVQGFVLRYRPEEKNVDGLPGDEGVFLPCSFWLAICLNWLGRKEEARELFERLLTLQNDLGLIWEEYDPRDKRLLGNFPQAFTHVSLIVAAQFLEEKK